MGVVGIADRSTNVGLTDKHAVVDGRLFVATVQAWGGPRIPVATVYRFTGGRLEAANLGMLQALGAEVRTIGLPFILGGDYHVAPSHMQENGFLTCSGASLSRQCLHMARASAKGDIRLLSISSSVMVLLLLLSRLGSMGRVTQTRTCQCTWQCDAACRI